MWAINPESEKQLLQQGCDKEEYKLAQMDINNEQKRCELIKKNKDSFTENATNPHIMRVKTIPKVVSILERRNAIFHC